MVALWASKAGIRLGNASTGIKEKRQNFGAWGLCIRLAFDKFYGGEALVCRLPSLCILSGGILCTSKD